VTLPNGRDNDWDAEEKAIAAARLEALTVILDEGGVPAVEALTFDVENLLALGYALGASRFAESDDDRILRDRLASQDRRSESFGRGFALGRGATRQGNWLELKAAADWLSPVQKAELLACMPSERATWDLARVDPTVDEAYWKRVYPFFKDSPDDIEYAARQLAQAGRAFTAAQRLGFRLKDPTPPSSTLIADILEAALRQHEPDDHTGSISYWLGELLDALAERGDIDEGRVARIEWGCAIALDHDRPLQTLHRELARSPEFYAELLGLMYRAEGDEVKEASEIERTQGNVAFRVLTSWKSLPATADGVVDGAALTTWIMTALDLTTRQGRGPVGAQKVGEVLSHSPDGAEGAWPHEAVREIIERVQNPEVERGFEIGRYNSRGVVSKGLTDGGAQERAIAERYRSSSDRIADRWPRTAAMLRRLEQLIVEKLDVKIKKQTVERTDCGNGGSGRSHHVETAHIRRRATCIAESP
jgi:hypothetical protein